MIARRPQGGGENHGLNRGYKHAIFAWDLEAAKITVWGYKHAIFAWHLEVRFAYHGTDYIGNTEGTR